MTIEPPRRQDAKENKDFLASWCLGGSIFVGPRAPQRRKIPNAIPLPSMGRVGWGVMPGVRKVLELARMGAEARPTEPEISGLKQLPWISFPTHSSG